jgi:hypothetical protein
MVSLLDRSEASDIALKLEEDDSKFDEVKNIDSCG